MSNGPVARAWFLACAVVLGARAAAAAAEHTGRITFGGLPLPGATVIATKGDERFATTSDQSGLYRFGSLAEGIWTVRVEMLGFSPVSRDITVPSDAQPPAWELTLLPFEEITHGLALATTADFAPAQPIAPSPSGDAGLSDAPGASGAGLSGPPDSDTGPFGAVDGLLISGSVNNAAASPFAQSGAFGNNRRGQRSLYNWGAGAVLGNSSWDARPFSFTGQRTPKPAYTDLQFMGTFGGPIRIRPLLTNGPIVFLGYQRTNDHTTTTQSAVMPTLAERRGDFSQSPIAVLDPATGLPFSGNVIPKERISAQAAALVALYPEPNVNAAGRYNYQTPVLVATTQDNFQSRLTQRINSANQLSGSVAYQRTATDTAGIFGFVDSTRVSSLDAAVNWSHRFSQLFSVRLRYQITRGSTRATPYFASRRNVSREAGIDGNNQEPDNWGPPALIFSSGLAGLGGIQYASNKDLTTRGSAEAVLSKGRHYLTFGGGGKERRFNVRSQQDARGTFTFSGAATGSDFADFLLGIPHSSSIAFGNADKRLRGPVYDSYINDDWRVNPAFTLNLGIRWEYESPLAETMGRLVNLDLAPGFVAASPVLASHPIGALTGAEYPSSLIRADKTGFQPRLGLAWRPIAGSSLVIRAGYGVYRNTDVYRSIAMLMAQQPPLSTTLSVENGPATPLTLANGFTTSPQALSNTFAIDPDFRVGYVQNWQISAQRDFRWSLTIIATYLGASGRRLMQEFLPNTYPAGATRPCAACPAGFVYLTSTGSSARHAGQMQVRRRLRNGLTATAQYTLSKAVDDATAFNGAALTGASIAQDWTDLAAERGPSSFDQRHLLTAQVQYTTGVGVAGGALMTGTEGALFKNWTLTSELTAGSGLPLTPVYLTSVSGTGVTGTLRADLTGASTGDVPAGYYLNPAAYARPAPGRWGSAGRNSVLGPKQFTLNAGISRTFLWGDRLNLDWRIDATNVLNRVTYAGIDTIVGSPQFGLPNRANAMRKLKTTLRLRF